MNLVDNIKNIEWDDSDLSCEDLLIRIEIDDKVTNFKIFRALVADSVHFKYLFNQSDEVRIGGSLYGKIPCEIVNKMKEEIKEKRHIFEPIFEEGWNNKDVEEDRKNKKIGQYRILKL